MTWKYAYASVKGTSHEKNGSPCQDASLCEVFVDNNGHEILVAVASDGAGSAVHSDQGSKLICSFFMEKMKAFLATGRSVEETSRTFFEAFLEHFQKEVSIRAEKLGSSPRDFACTFLCAVIADTYAAFAQIGDGAIVAWDEAMALYNWQFWPQQGEYENTTYFATDPKAMQKLEFADHKGIPCLEVALFSDGLQRLALHYQTQTAHTPFFRPFFVALRSQEEPVSETYTKSLITFLNSVPVNERTDDDKTLILATRRGA